MVKKILINSCDNCPKLAIKWNQERKGYTDYVCRLMIRKNKEDIVIQNIHNIPDWCPLPEDAQGLVCINE